MIEMIDRVVVLFVMLQVYYKIGDDPEVKANYNTMYRYV